VFVPEYNYTFTPHLCLYGTYGTAVPFTVFVHTNWCFRRVSSQILLYVCNLAYYKTFPSHRTLSILQQMSLPPLKVLELRCQPVTKNLHCLVLHMVSNLKGVMCVPNSGLGGGLL